MVDVMDVPFLDLRAVNARYADALKTAAARVIDAGWYVLGQELVAFEDEFASYCGTTQAVGVGNGLDALALILRGYRELGVLREGDEIIVPANTFIATFLAISQNHLVLVPVEPDRPRSTSTRQGWRRRSGPARAPSWQCTCMGSWLRCRPCRSWPIATACC